MCAMRWNLFLVVFSVVLVVGTVVEKSRMKPAAPRSTSAVTVVDVAHGVDAGSLATIVRLGADERVVAVDDKPVDNDLAAGAAIAEHPLDGGRYLDLTVGGPRGNRRVLVLMH